MIYLHFKWGGGGYTKSEVDTLLNGKSDTGHTHTKSQITDFPSYGTTANTICEGNDSRLNDARTPTSHTHTKSEITDFPSLATVATSGSYNDLSNKPTIPTVNNATLTIQKNGTDVKTFTANASSDVTCNITVPTKVSELTNDSGFLTSHQSLSGYVPRSGGAVMTGPLYRVNNYDVLVIAGGTDWSNSGSIALFGGNADGGGLVRLFPHDAGVLGAIMELYPNGTWTWGGTAVQLQSDRRVKQQISKIDNALLDAWEDVEPVQFKYNDAVEQKGDNARLHTGYVVQQIDEACQKHDVDISDYGLYCHEEYPERTEEVTITNEDGTTSKETKVIEPAKEYYSLRYTEALIVECAYLRRENAKLKEQLQSHEDYLKLVEEHLHLKNL